MATTLFPSRQVSNPQGVAGIWLEQNFWDGMENHHSVHMSALRTTRGSALATASTTSVASATGLMATSLCVTDAIAAPFTLSGTVTFNTWASESSMNANAGAKAAVFKLDRFGALTLVGEATRGTELGTSRAVQNWTMTPTSTAFVKGDRIAVIFGFGNAGGTMAAGFALTLAYSGTTDGADGDTFVTFTENITFLTTAPAGSTLFYTDTTSPVSVGGKVCKEMWTSRGGGVTQAELNTVTGPVTSPIQWTDDTTSDLPIEWYSKPLTAFTLGGLVGVIVRNRIPEDTFPFTNNCCCFVELAVVNGDGTGATVWASHLAGVGEQDDTGECTNAEITSPARQVYLCAPDVSVTDGQRLRLRVYAVENWSDLQAIPMESGWDAELRYNGTSANADGDAYLTLSQSVTEFSGGPPAGDDLIVYLGGGYYG